MFGWCSRCVLYAQKQNTADFKVVYWH